MFIDVAKIVFLFVNTKLYMEKSEDLRYQRQDCQLANFFLKSLILASKPLQWTESGSLK